MFCIKEIKYDMYTYIYTAIHIFWNYLGAMEYIKFAHVMPARGDLKKQDWSPVEIRTWSKA